jgi:hypothetical protein
MILPRRQFLATAAALPVLAACAEPPRPPDFPPISFAPRGTFRFAALRVEVAFEYQAPLAPPNVEHLFARTPEATLRLWAAERLAASGSGERFVRFVVADARVTETDLPRTQGIRGAFTSEPAQRYDARIECAVEVRQQRGNFRDGLAAAAATRSRSVLENISLNDRERVWYEMVRDMMRDIDAELHRQIEASLTRFFA